jgi:Carboxymuconolactone decarboxylase family
LFRDGLGPAASRNSANWSSSPRRRPPIWRARSPLHARGALNRGATRDEIIETILQCAPYIGFPKTNHALKAAKDVFDQWEAKKEDWKLV